MRPANTPGRIRMRVAWLLSTCVACLVFGVAGVVFYPKGDDATPTVYHHADGTFSLNRQNGPAVTPEDVRTCLMEYESFGRVPLVCNPLTRLADWNPILNAGGAAGAPFYQIESDGKIFTLMLPCSDGYSLDEFNPMATIIKLSDAEKPPLDLYPGSDVFVIVDTATTCEEALTALSGYDVSGKSITIISEFAESAWRLDWVVFDHRKDESALPKSFKRLPSEFWTKHIQPTIDRLKSVF